MRMLIDDDGTFEIIEIKIVRISDRTRESEVKAMQTSKNNNGRVMRVVRASVQTLILVCQVASAITGIALLA